MVTAAKPKIGGAISYAPENTALPTDAVSELPAAFVNVGYISDAGVTRSTELDTETVKAWGGDVVYVLNNSRTETFQFVMLENGDTNVLKLTHGDGNVSGTLEDGITVKSKNEQSVPRVYVIDMIEAKNTLHRIVIPKGVITSIGDMTYVDNAVLSRDITITCIADDQENTVYEYMKTVLTESTESGGESTESGGESTESGGESTESGGESTGG